MVPSRKYNLTVSLRSCRVSGTKKRFILGCDPGPCMPGKQETFSFCGKQLCVIETPLGPKSANQKGASHNWTFRGGTGPLLQWRGSQDEVAALALGNFSLSLGQWDQGRPGSISVRDCKKMERGGRRKGEDRKGRWRQL